MNQVIRFTAAGILLVTATSATIAGEKKVGLLRTPASGIQPQPLVDAAGNLHLLYFEGETLAGNLMYVRRPAGKSDFSTPVRVNSQPGSAVATGTIRGGQIALGKDGRLHVVWNGSGKALPKGPTKGNPMLYARSNDAGTAFDEQRNMMTKTDIIDGGGTVAADRAGNVYVAWHAQEVGAKHDGEQSRRVWLALSKDDGKTFAAESAVDAKTSGACACCAMRAFVDKGGNAYLLYRAAEEGVHRNMTLLTSADRGKAFESALLHKWHLQTCPMSSEAFAEGPGGIYTAWETKGQVYFARVKPGKAAIEEPIAALGDGKDRKHPSLAVNARGDVLVVWCEGTGWKRGGSLAWQVYDRNGRPTSESGRVENGIPVWSFASAFVDADDRFVIVH